MENVDSNGTTLAGATLGGVCFELYQRFFDRITALRQARTRGYVQKTVFVGAVAACGYFLARRKLRQYTESLELTERLRLAETPHGGDSSGESVVPLGEIHACPVANLPKGMRLVVTLDPTDSARYIKVCNAVRVGDHIVLPAHAVSQVDHFYVVEGRGSKNYIRVDVDQLREITTDLLAGKLDPNQFARIGMSQVKIADYNTPTMVTAFSSVATKEPPAEGYSSVGMLYPDDGFGYMQFSGSTRPGFSGGLYQVGTRSFAIHMRRGPPGAHYNLGISLAYVSCLLQEKVDDDRKRDGESTEEYILNLARGKDKRLSYQKEEDGDFIFRVGDRYLRVSADRYWELYAEDDYSSSYNPKPIDGEAATSEAIEFASPVDPPVPVPRTSVHTERRIDTWETDRDRIFQLLTIISERITEVENSGESASDVEFGAGYVGDQISVKPRVPAETFDQYFLDQRPQGTAYTVPGALIKTAGNVTVEPVRVVTQEVMDRITSKADAVSLQKQLQEKRTNLVDQLQRCAERFRIAGSDVTAHEKVSFDHHRLLGELSIVNDELRTANVNVSQASVQTVVEKSAARKAAKERKKLRIQASKEKVNELLNSAVTRDHVDTELEAAIKVASEAATALRNATPVSVKDKQSTPPPVPARKKKDSAVVPSKQEK